MWPTAYNPPGEASDLPAITVNRYGKGTAYFVAFPLAVNVARRATLDPSPRVLLANLIRKATDRPFLRTNAPLLVEAVANRTPDGGAIVHLINWYAGVEGNYSLKDAMPGIADLHLDIDASRSVRLEGVRRLRRGVAGADGSGQRISPRGVADPARPSGGADRANGMMEPGKPPPEEERARTGRALPARRR